MIWCRKLNAQFPSTEKETRGKGEERGEGEGEERMEGGREGGKGQGLFCEDVTLNPSSSGLILLNEI